MWLFIIIGIWLLMLFGAMAYENYDRECARICNMALRSRQRDLHPKPKRCARYVR